MSKRPRPLKSQAQLEAEKLIQRANDLDAVNLPPDAAILERQHDIEITRQGQTRDGRKVEGEQARRLDAFASLREGMVAGAYDAARRFETDIMIRRGENDRGPPTERISRTAGFTTDRMLQAADDIEAVVAILAPRDWWLLMELISPSIDRGGWRETVRYITGEKHTEAQSAAVRACCVNLRDAYAALERRAA